MALISVVIPAYNRAALLREAVASVLAQSLAEVELIIVDDGSTDDTPAVAAAFTGDVRVQFVRQANQGRSHARNHGARLAHGEWLGFLDSDDRYCPRALADHLAVIQRQPGLGLTLGGYEHIDASGDRIGERRPWEEGPLTAEGWLFNCYGLPGAMLVQRAWFERAGGFDPASEFAEDWDLFLRLAQAGCPMAWVETNVCQYRQHAGNSVGALELHRQGSLRALDKFFQAPGLPPEIVRQNGAARAWVNVHFARKHYAAGQHSQGHAALQEAVTLDPNLAGIRKMRLLEALVDGCTPDGQLPRPPAIAAFPRTLNIHPVDLRRATGRVAMARFFRLRSRSSSEARRHLLAGLRYDPRWLANRGVLSFLIEQVLHV
jgi:glycosyltransferase involved in cell wall biosynthesis